MLSDFGLNIAALAQTTIPAAGTVTTTPVTGLAGARNIAAQAKFLYGAGGTSVKAYLQTSLDAGVTWIDIACFAFTTSAATKVSALQTAIALAAAVTPTDGSLSDNTILNGLFGDRVRLKYIVVGTYTGASSLQVDLVVRR